MVESTSLPEAGRRSSWWQRGFVTLTMVLVIALGAGLCFAPGVQRRSAGLFGGLAQRVKNRPAEAAVLCAGCLVLLWGGVGLLAAGQEIRAKCSSRKGNSA